MLIESIVGTVVAAVVIYAMWKVLQKDAETTTPAPVVKEPVVSEPSDPALVPESVTIVVGSVEATTVEHAAKPDAEKPKRARTAKGTFKADDKATDQVNEAWVDGKAPEKAPKAKKPRKPRMKVIK
jgi:hypothetical protein